MDCRSLIPWYRIRSIGSLGNYSLANYSRVLSFNEDNGQPGALMDFIFSDSTNLVSVQFTAQYSTLQLRNEDDVFIDYNASFF